MHKRKHPTTTRHHTTKPPHHDTGGKGVDVYSEPLQIDREDEPRAVAIVERYADLMSAYEAQNNTSYQDLIASTSINTDRKVLRMLGVLGLYSKDSKNYKQNGAAFTSDVLYLAKVIWNAAMSHPVMQKETDIDPRMLDVHYVINQFNDDHSKLNRYNTLETIYRTKQLYVSQVRPRSDVCYCMVLTCWERIKNDDLDAFKMNSMQYCKRHRGVALFNGLRHNDKFCGSCGIWNILALKDTCADWGHNEYHASHLKVPSTSNTTNMSHREENVDIRWHKAEGTPAYVKFNDDTVYFHPMAEVYEHRPSYYSQKYKKVRSVPSGSLVTTPLNKLGLVDAWIQAKGYDVDTGRRRNLMDLEEIYRIFNKYRVGGNPMCVDSRPRDPDQSRFTRETWSSEGHGWGGEPGQW
jgi:hypothetical protein